MRAYYTDLNQNTATLFQNPINKKTALIVRSARGTLIIDQEFPSWNRAKEAMHIYSDSWKDNFTGKEDTKTYIHNINGQYYSFEGDPRKSEVYSIGADSPKDAGIFCARWTDTGIKYVASPSPTRAAAISKARRAGTYCGEV